MKAKVNAQHACKFTSSHRKEDNLMREVSALVPSSYNKTEMEAVVTLRTYYTKSRGSNTACIWLRTKAKDGGHSTHLSGSGSAGGGGYHRPSAAAQYAIANAGIELSDPIDGRGDELINEAVLAIAKAAGWKNARLHIAYG